MRRCWLVVVAWLFAGLQSSATDFRIETSIFVADEEEAASTSTTLYHQGVFYDLHGVSRPSTMFRPPLGSTPGRFVLLDPARQIRTEFTSDQVDLFVAKLHQWALRNSDPLIRAAAQPVFTTSWDESNGNLKLLNERLSYDVATEPIPHADGAESLRQFFDYFAKLNSMTAGGLPPQARMQLNQALYEHDATPVTVKLTFGNDEDDEPALRAEHKMAWLLSKADHDAIAMVNEQLVKFRQVDNAEYQRLMKVDDGQ